MPNENTLSMKWSKREKDLITHYPTKPDGALVHFAFSSKSYRPLTKTWEPSFIEELKERGYDITTLKFSIKKLPEQPTTKTTNQ